MTELEQKAEEYIRTEGFGAEWNDITAYEANREIEKAYKDGYEQGQKDSDSDYTYWATEYAKKDKENAELKAEIEKLKVCGSCKYVCYSALEEPCIHCANCFACKDKSHNKWELAE